MDDPAPPPSYESATTAQPVDRSSVLASTESRLQASTSSSSSAAAEDKDRDLKLSFHRIIDSQILARSPKKLALESVEALIKVTENALKEGSEEEREKFRSLRMTNSMIKRLIVDVPGAKDYLLACKFSPRVRSFTEHLVFPLSPTPSQTHHLSLGHLVLTTKLSSIRESAATEERMKAREEEAEKGRKGKALEEMREDRERKRMRDGWARQGRMAQAEQAAGEVEQRTAVVAEQAEATT